MVKEECKFMFEFRNILFVVVQLLSHVRLFATPWTAARQASVSFTTSQNLPTSMSIELVMPSNHLIPVIPFSFCLQSFPASGSFLMSWLFPSSCQSTGASASQSNSGLIFFRIGWFDLLAVQRTLKSLLQHHSSKTSILWWSAFFMVQL